MTTGAVYYAEHELGVHRVETETKEARARLEGIQRELASVRDQKRRLEAALSSVELDVLTEERGKHPSQSATWLKDHLKMELRKRPAWLETQEAMLKVTHRIDSLEMDRSLATRDIEIGTGRMHELAGYFHYLAAVRMAELAKPASA